MNTTNPSTIWPNGVKPKIGDIATSNAVNRSGRAIHIWEACPGCGDERWVKRNARGHLCNSCALRKHSFGENNHRWNKSRKIITKSGIRVYVDKTHPFFCMAGKCSRGFAILEHRLVMAQHLERPLKPHEIVHHIDGNNLNNDISNLLLLSCQAVHTSFTMLQSQIYKLQRENTKIRSRITLLEAENTILRFSKGNGNPELAGGNPRASVETLHCLSLEDKEKVHSPMKMEGESASLEPIPVR